MFAKTVARLFEEARDLGEHEFLSYTRIFLVISFLETRNETLFLLPGLTRGYTVVKGLTVATIVRRRSLRELVSTTTCTFTTGQSLMFVIFVRTEVPSGLL